MLLEHNKEQWNFNFDDGTTKNDGQEWYTTMSLSNGKIFAEPGRKGNVLYCNGIRSCITFSPSTTKAAFICIR